MKYRRSAGWLWKVSTYTNEKREGKKRSTTNDDCGNAHMDIRQWPTDMGTSERMGVTKLPHLQTLGPNFKD